MLGMGAREFKPAKRTDDQQRERDQLVAPRGIEGFAYLSKIPSDLLHQADPLPREARSQGKMCDEDQQKDAGKNRRREYKGGHELKWKAKTVSVKAFCWKDSEQFYIQLVDEVNEPIKGVRPLNMIEACEGSEALAVRQEYLEETRASRAVTNEKSKRPLAPFCPCAFDGGAQRQLWNPDSQVHCNTHCDQRSSKRKGNRHSSPGVFEQRIVLGLQLDAWFAAPPGTIPILLTLSAKYAKMPLPTGVLPKYDATNPSDVSATNT